MNAKRQLILLVVGLACCWVYARNGAEAQIPQATSSSTTAASPITGVWRAQMDGLPAFTLVVTDEGGELQGAILFYLIRRGKPGEPATATPGIPEPIFHPAFDGKTLRFQVSHRRAHPPRTLSDPPVTFELTLTDDGKAQVSNLNEGHPIIVTRSDY